MTAVAQVTSVMVEPHRWMVAHRGTVKLAMPSLTPLRLLACRATGMVAALDMVPSAVK